MAKKTSDKGINEENIAAKTNGKTRPSSKVKGKGKVTDEAKKDPVDQKEVKVAVDENDFKDKYLRLSADFDNYRKRTLKEKMDLVKTAGENTLVDILPVMDDFDRAMESINNAKDLDAVKTGMKLIHNKFSEFLKSKGVAEIDSLHNSFDTEFHEAVTKIPAENKKLKGKVVDVIQKGYMLHEKVLRYAKVVVGE
jgi:molecular chaperone GrpE